MSGIGKASHVEGTRRHRDDIGALAGFQRPDLLVDPHRAGTFNGAEFEHAAGGELEFVERAGVLRIAHIAHYAEQAGAAD